MRRSSLTEALQMIIDIKGFEVLNKGYIVIGLLADIAPNLLKKELPLLQLVMSFGIWGKLLHASNGSKTEQKSVMTKSIKELNQKGLKDSTSRELVSCIAGTMKFNDQIVLSFGHAEVLNEIRNFKMVDDSLSLSKKKKTKRKLKITSSGYYRKGIGALDSGNYKEAFRHFSDGAKQKDGDCIYRLGTCYDYGYGCIDNKVIAVRYYKRAAELGQMEAQNAYGYALITGKGISGFPSETEGVSWISEAAKQGLAEAQYNLGMCLKDGRGIKTNMEAAIEQFYKAANAGHELAQKQLKLYHGMPLNNAGYFHL